MIELLWNRAEQPSALLVLAHGAGAPMDSDFMNLMAEAIAGRGVSVVRFEFPYMARRRQEQRKFPPNRAPQLLAHFREVLAVLPEDSLPVWIGGKSMGGRMASLLAAEADCPPIHGVVALGYPFHPPGKPEKTRTKHLRHLTVPMLICQGERDPFGKPKEVAGYGLPGNVRVHWLASGDHDFKPLKRSGLIQADLIEESAVAAAGLIQEG